MGMKISEVESTLTNHSVDVTLKTWLEVNVCKVLKGSLTRKAMECALNQWTWSAGYCDRGDLQISNILAENAIRPFAIGRKPWLFSDTSRGARASATWYSLIETSKANSLEPSAYIQHVLKRTRWRSWNCCYRGMRSWNRLRKKWLRSTKGKRVDLRAYGQLG